MDFIEKFVKSKPFQITWYFCGFLLSISGFNAMGMSFTGIMVFWANKILEEGSNLYYQSAPAILLLFGIYCFGYMAVHSLRKINNILKNY